VATDPAANDRPGDVRLIRPPELVNTPYTDDDGRPWIVLAPQDTTAFDLWRYPRVGPPAVAERLEAQGWPRDAANKVQANLIADGMLTARDMRRQGASEVIEQTVRRSLRASVQDILEMYRE